MPPRGGGGKSRHARAVPSNTRAARSTVAKAREEVRARDAAAFRRQADPMRSAGGASPRVTRENINDVIAAQNRSLAKHMADAANPRVSSSTRKNAKQFIGDTKQRIKNLQTLKRREGL